VQRNEIEDDHQDGNGDLHFHISVGSPSPML
jgi:hypothetical protein